MPLIVEIEEFLKEARCHIVDASGKDTLLMICLPRQDSGQNAADPVAAHLVADDDDLITWEDAAWQ